MQEHLRAGSGLRVACSLPPVVGATAFACAEASVPQSSTRLARAASVPASRAAQPQPQPQGQQGRGVHSPSFLALPGLSIPLLNILSLNITFFFLHLLFFFASLSQLY